MCTVSKTDINVNGTSGCYTITIDTDGPKKGENSDATINMDGNKIKNITGDRFYVYVSSTGIAVGTGAASQILEAED